MKTTKHIDQFDENEVRETFHKFVDESRSLAANALASYIADGVATHHQIVNFLAESRKGVEDEVIAVVDAMSMAVDAKGERLKQLRSTTEKTSAEVAFMKQQLNTVNAKVVEIEALTAAMSRLTQGLRDFKELVDDGTLERAAAAARAVNP